MSPLTPEISVRDTARSLAFWCGVVGLRVVYDRPEDGFAMLGLGEARRMIDRMGTGRTFNAGPVRAPGASLGLGLNLELEVPDLEDLSRHAEAAGARVVLPLEVEWYRVGHTLFGQRQMVLADPDGYLVRPFRPLGQRAVDSEGDAADPASR